MSERDKLPCFHCGRPTRGTSEAGFTRPTCARNACLDAYDGVIRSQFRAGTQASRITTKDKAIAAAKAGTAGLLALVVIPLGVYRGSLRSKTQPPQPSDIDWQGFGQRAAMALWPIVMETFVAPTLEDWPIDDVTMH
jgi:hypothetical protein